MSRIFGIDISKWQNPASIDYDRLARQLDFAILRVGFTGHNNGRNPRNFNLDTTFERHYNELNKRGVPIGVYWYGGGKTLGEVDREVALTLQAIKGKNIKYPVYYDVEENLTHGKLNKADLTAVTVAYCNKIKSAGYHTGVYASLSWFKNKLDINALKPFDIWLAHWGVSNPGMACDLWQYSSDGKLDGHAGRLDVNIAFKDYNTKNPNPPVVEGLTDREIANEILNNPKHIYGDGDQRKKILGNRWRSVQDVINSILYPKLTDRQIAEEILNNPKHIYGDGDDRKKALGNRWGAVQDIINATLYPKATPIKVGDTVLLKTSAKKYATGQNIPAWVKGKRYQVSQLKGDRALLMPIYSWVLKNDIIK